MRIWNANLVPLLCRQHLIAVWREGLGCIKIIQEDKKGYRNHPAVKEFENNTQELYNRLSLIRNEMLKRGYHPKELPVYSNLTSGQVKEWESLAEQITKLKLKGCGCLIQ